MNILAIDSSGLVASVALLVEGEVIAEYTTNFKKTHSQTLLPMLDEIVTMTGYELEEIDAIAVAEGPGSFTGLRIGSATAKGLGLALKKPIIPIPTVDGLAYNLFETKQLICPIMDAKRNQVYTGIYSFQQSTFQVVKEQMAVSIEELLELLLSRTEDVIFLGDGVPVFKEKIESVLKERAYFAPSHLSRQRAGAIGALAELYYKQGKVVSAAEHEPVYLRMSQAERERKERMGELHV